MNVFSLKDAEELVASGAREFKISLSRPLTPSARDFLVENGIRVLAVESAGQTQGTAPAAPSTESQWERLFRSPEAEQIKRDICEIGRRLWMREYVDGNGGNISYRIADNAFLCTPTLVSKGFLTPDMICLVDIDGKQLAGSSKRTSEITTHMAIYRAVPAAKSVVHAHPVHATAFAITGVEPPERLIPEIEVFVGRVPLAPYRTPGSPAMAEVIGPLAPKHQAILMGNHGVITWSPTSVEDAYFKMEIVDAYCRTVVVASHLPNKHTSIPCDEMGLLLDMKKGLGLPDVRFGLKPVELCEIDPWQAMAAGGSSAPGCGCNAPQSGQPSGQSSSQPPTAAELERTVQAITDQILAGLQGRS